VVFDVGEGRIEVGDDFRGGAVGQLERADQFQGAVAGHGQGQRTPGQLDQHGQAGAAHQLERA